MDAIYALFVEIDIIRLKKNKSYKWKNSNNKFNYKILKIM